MTRQTRLIRMGHAAWWRPAIGAVAVFATLAAVGVVVAPGALAENSHECADVLFLGARGSNEAGPGTVSGWTPTDEDPLGLGAPVKSAYDTFSSELEGHRSIQAISVDYPARAVAWSSDFLLHMDEYFAGLGEGVDFVDTTLRARAEACPDERIVLAGYSQGAMVMHRAIHRLSESTSASGILARMDAAILIGDGDRVPRDKTDNYGDFHKNLSGIGLHYSSQSGSSTARFAKSVQSRILMVCNRNDPICDSTGLLADFLWLNRHFSYPGGADLASAAAVAASSVLSVPLPKPRVVDLRPQVNESFEYQLSADISSDYKLEWDVSIPFVMPAGLSLSKSGLISGIPESTPSGETQIQVRGVILGVRTDWVPVTLRWNAIASGDRLLIAGQGDTSGSGNGSDIPDLAAALASAGYQVTTSPIIPTDLSTFGQIWWVDVNAPALEDLDRLVGFAKEGHGLFLTGEWGCCSVSSSIDYVLNRLVVTVGGIFTSNGYGDVPPAPVNPGVVGKLADSPNVINTWTSATPGFLNNVSGDNVFVSTEPDGQGQVLAGAWDADDVIGGGRAVAMMDINWLGDPYRGQNWQDVAGNIAFFLSGLDVVPQGQGSVTVESQGIATMQMLLDSNRSDLTQPIGAAGPASLVRP